MHKNATKRKELYFLKVTCKHRGTPETSDKILLQNKKVKLNKVLYTNIPLYTQLVKYN